MVKEVASGKTDTARGDIRWKDVSSVESAVHVDFVRISVVSMLSIRSRRDRDRDSSDVQPDQVAIECGRDLSCAPLPKCLACVVRAPVLSELLHKAANLTCRHKPCKLR